MDSDRAIGSQRSHAEGHRDAVIAMRPDFTGADCATFDDNPVRGRFSLDPQRLQAVSHHLDAVRLLDAQLFGTAQRGATFGTGRSYEEHREFVDRQRNQILRNVDTLELRATHANIRYRLAAHLARILQREVTAHQLQNVDYAGTGRIHADMLEHDL